jgi:hypothetical protein
LQASKIETTRSWISSLRSFGRDVLRQRGGGLVDRFGRFQDLLGGLFGATDHGAELAVDLGHFIAVETLAVQHRDLALGAIDGVVDQVKLDLELLALFDLGAVGLEQGLRLRHFAIDCFFGRFRRASGGHRHLGADGAQLVHDLAVHRADIDLGTHGHHHRCVAENGLFNSEALAIDRHGCSSHPFTPHPL